MTQTTPTAVTTERPHRLSKAIMFLLIGVIILSEPTLPNQILITALTTLCVIQILRERKRTTPTTNP